MAVAWGLSRPSGQAPDCRKAGSRWSPRGIICHLDSSKHTNRPSWGQRGMQKCGIQLFPRRHEPTCQHHQQAKSSPSSDRTLGAYLCTRHLPWLAGRSGSGRAAVGAIAIAASSGVNPMDRQQGARWPCGHNDTREKRQAYGGRGVQGGPMPIRGLWSRAKGSISWQARKCGSAGCLVWKSKALPGHPQRKKRLRCDQRPEE